MSRTIALALTLVSASAYAVDSLEFQLFGVAANGRQFDIRPYSEDTYSDGDVNDPEGIHGKFFAYIGTAKKESHTFVGACSVRHKEAYIFSCSPGDALMSGVVYEGQPLEDAKRHPEAKKLYRAFIARYEYGALAALYRCKRGCKATLPSYLIFVWRGD